ncbi:MAG: rod shape-determining protein MreC, partial [Gammaproteobacteria bacterium]
REQLLLSRRVQQMSSLLEENKRLRSLLLSSQSLDENVLIAEVIGVDNDPFRHEVILDRGANDGISVGLAIIDQKGLMGQVIHVGPFTSRALLITDEAHATPVQVVRNGVRAIAVGTGKLDKLQLIHVPDTADLLVGDVLVSSGLGGRFPAGYPVATITYIENDPGQPFALVEAKPTSYLDRRLLVLIIQPGERVPFH